MSEKITARHLARPAMLYIRQSTAHQLVHNEESRRLQYAMADRLRSLGWREVQIVDDDLGKSAAGMVDRPGFQRLVSQVSLGKIGAVGARELSRLARNNVDWQRLMEVCRYVDTLLVDHDAVYDVRHANDRLLLGLKGNLNEYELDLLRVRAFEARLEKARRGEYYARVAVGYRKAPEGALEKHPDARVQHTIRLVFEKVLEFGSARQVLLWMRAHGLEVPVNRTDRGDLVWKGVSYAWLHMVLTNPIYAGAYAYRRTMAVATLRADGTRQRRVIPRPAGDAAVVLLPDHHEGYIDRATFDRIQTLMSRNSQSRWRPGPGAPRVGPALLAGLLRCRRCGARLVVNYSGTAVRVHRYECSRAHASRGEARCINFSGLDVDARLAELALEVVQPGALEAAQQLVREEGARQDALREALELELQAARYTAERAQRQYDAVEPENRLVAEELERRWNAALERVRESERRLEPARPEPACPPLDPARLAALAADVARVWHDPASDVRLKKRILRTLIEEIVVDVDEHDILLVVHWKGGIHTEVAVRRRRRGNNRGQTPADVTEAVRLLARVSSDDHIARALNASGIPTARGNPWTRELVRSLRSSHAIPVCTREGDAEWLTLAGAAQLVGVAELTLKRAIERGVVAALRPVSRGPWIISKAALLRPSVLRHITKKPRAQSGEPAVPNSQQLTLVIPRL